MKPSLHKLAVAYDCDTYGRLVPGSEFQWLNSKLMIDRFRMDFKRLVAEVVMAAVVGSERTSVWEKWGNMWSAAIWRRLLRSATGWRSILYEDRPCTKLDTCVSALLTLLYETLKKSKVFFFDEILFRSTAVTISFHLLKSLYSHAWEFGSRWVNKRDFLFLDPNFIIAFSNIWRRTASQTIWMQSMSLGNNFLKCMSALLIDLLTKIFYHVTSIMVCNFYIQTLFASDTTRRLYTYWSVLFITGHDCKRNPKQAKLSLCRPRRHILE